MKWDFQGWLRKNNVEFPGVFVFCLGVPERSNSILWNIQGFSFVLSGISKGKVKKWEISGGGGEGFKKVYPQPSMLGFFLEKPNAIQVTYL